MKKLTNYLLTAAIAGVFFSCSESTTERDSESLKAQLNAAAINKASLASVGISNWMSALQDNVSLSQISVPGTHDSGATVEFPSGTAKTQNLTITEQLNIGVRFLDIRCRHIDDSFAIHHGPVYQKLNFDDVLNAVYAFLDSHPTETVIMSVKEEYNASNTTRSFEKTFDAYVQKNPSKWDLGNNIPKLGDIRGKIRLLRRFPADSKPKGIDATNWADNTTFEISNDSPVKVKVQDNYKVDNNDTKWSQIQSVLTEAKADTSGKLFINFTSGYKPLIFGIPSIPTVSNAINPKLKTFFQSSALGSYGILPIDFISAELAEPIVKTNFSNNP